MRVCSSVAVLVVLTSAYVANPPAGWVALAATSVALFVWRSKKTSLDAAETQTR